jgi:PAS domain S-box-containing protein
VEIAERRRAEEALRRLAESLEARVRERTAELARVADELAEKAAIVEHSNDAIFSVRPDGIITSWNPAAVATYGYTAGEIVGASMAELTPEDRRAETATILERVFQGQTVGLLETQRTRNDGSTIDVFVTISPIRDAEGGIRGASVIARDISERKRNQEHMREVQKLESLGLIAGGVAHDFNNLLVGILGNASMVLEAMEPSSPNYELLDNVIMASEKAAHLTQQLLAYAGKGRFVSAKLDLSSLVREISSLIQTSIPKAVQVRLDLAENLPSVEADPGQIQQVIMNLVINGAEAMGQSAGTVLVTTGVRQVNAEHLRRNFAGEAIEPGMYCTIEVHDTGCGMDESVRARIFDPFFTTKFTGRGLGLSAVLGIVRSHRGSIRVSSETGKGSTFEILLPAVPGSSAPARTVETYEELRGSGLVLLVDDEELVRAAAATALDRYGYRVLIASDGKEAVELYRRTPDEIDLVLLDMTMPVMSGEEALRQIRGIRPGARVIVSSGYDEMEATRLFTAQGVAAFVKKPYSAATLAKAVKRAMRRQ